MKRLLYLFACLVAALPVMAFAAWPEKPVRLVVPYSAGGQADAIARLVAQPLGQRLGQQVVVDNKPGASGMIGAGEVARSAPDGYTLLLDASAHAVNPSLFAKVPFDSERDLAPVSLLVQVPSLLVVPVGSPFQDVPQLVKAAQQKPGKVSYASAGNGTATHLAAELFRQGFKVDLLHVPYKGGAPALSDLVGAQVDMMFSSVAASSPLVKAGKLRALASTGSKRAEAFPNLPTIAELGLRDYQVYEWNGVFAPAKTPKPVIDRLESELRQVMATPEVRARLAEIGAVPISSGATDFREFLRRETVKWAQVVRAAGIKAE